MTHLNDGIQNEMSFEKLVQELTYSGEMNLEWAKIEVAEQIAIAMKRAGVSKAELARRLKKSRAYVTQILQGDVNFTIESIVKLAECLGCKLEVKLSDKGINYWKQFGQNRINTALISNNLSQKNKAGVSDSVYTKAA